MVTSSARSCDAGSADFEVASTREAARMLGCGVRQVGKLGLHGAIEVHLEKFPKSSRLQFHVPRGATLESIYHCWVEGVETWDFEASYRHKRIRAAAKIPFERPQPEGLDVFASEVLGPGGFKVYEMAAFYTAGQRHRTFHRNRLLDRAVSRVLDGEDGACSPAVVLRRFPKLGGLPETVLDPNADEAVEPDHADLGKAMRLGPLAEPTCALLLITAASARHNVEVLLRAFVRLDARIGRRSGRGAPTAATIVSACRALLAEDQPDVTAKRIAVSTVRNVVQGLRFLRITAGRYPEAFAHLRPTCDLTTRDNVDLRLRCRSIESEVGRIYKERRLGQVDELMERIVDVENVAPLRLEQVVSCEQDMVEQAPAAIAHFEKHDERPDLLPPYHQFDHLTTVIDQEGRLVAGSSQVCRIRIWRAKDLWSDLSPGVAGDKDLWDLGDEGMELLIRAAGGDMDLAMSRRRHAEDERLVFECVDVVPVNGGRTERPWFVRLVEDAVVLPPTQLSPERQAIRRATMAELDLPEFPPTSNRLFGNSTDTKGLAGAMAKRDRVLLPIEALGMGARFSTLMLDGIEETLCRIGEMLQIEQHPDRWKDVPTATGSAKAFLAVPKLHDEHLPMEVSDDFYEKALSLARRSAILSGHPEGYLPYVSPSVAVSVRLPEHRPIIFQFEDAAIEAMEISYAVNILLMGVARVTSHLLRHARARLLRKRGVPKRMRMLKLNHRSPTIEDHYSRGDPRRRLAENARQTERRKSATRSAGERRRKVRRGT